MTIQEERLTILEQTVAALRRDMRGINHQETMLLGMAMKQEEDIREMNVSLASLSERLDTFERNVNNRFETLEQSVNSRFETQQRLIESFEQSVNGRFDAVDGRLGTLEGRFDAVESRLGTLEGRFDVQEKKLDQIMGMLTTLTNRPELSA